MLVSHVLSHPRLSYVNKYYLLTYFTFTFNVVWGVVSRWMDASVRNRTVNVTEGCDEVKDKTGLHSSSLYAAIHCYHLHRISRHATP